jgi:lysophospholipase L1-like esterase
VYAPNDGLIVGFGDSITVGFLASDEGWPYWLANRLVQLAAQGGPRYSIIDMGISGNDVSFDRSGYGVSAEHRLQRDVLDQTGLKAVLMLEGINDIGGSNLPTPTLEGGLASVVARVRAAGAGILLSPMTPSGDATAPAPYGLNYSSPAGEQERHDVNGWIRRSSGAYSPFFDFDPVIADPQEPNHIALAYNSADNLHPSVPGQQAMAASIDLATVEQVIPASPPMTGLNRLRLDSTRLVVRKRRVFVPLTCDSTRQCSGLFSIDANLPLAHSGSATAVCLVSRDAFYRLGAHERQTVSVPMQQSCLRALERHRGKLRVKVTSWPRTGQHGIVSYATLSRK